MDSYLRFKQLSQTKRSAIICAAALLVTVLAPFANKAEAATQMSAVMIEMNNMNASAATIGTVCLKPATTSTTTLKTYNVTFPGNGTQSSTSFGVSTTAANWQTANISTTANPFWPSGASAMPNATSATATISGATVTWTNATAQSVTAGTWYCFNWTNSAALSQPTSANSSEIGYAFTCNNTTLCTFSGSLSGAGANVIDAAGYATATLTASTGNNFVVNATVNPNFSFAISQTSTTLTPNITPTTQATDATPTTSTLSTNATNGWFVWGSDTFSGLRSSTAGYTINVSGHSVTPNTANTAATGADWFLTNVSSSQTGGSGTITVATPFAGAANHGSAFDHTTQDLVASSNGTANNAVLTYTNYADVGSITPAATDYTDTITLYAAGSF